MGHWWSSSPASSDVEEISTVTTPNPFKYPPKTGSYFGSHFIMGGEKFETPQPEQYLFGDNSDLNYLGGKPVPFPYPAPSTNEPTKPLKALVYIRKESLKFVKVPDSSSYNIEFVFDSDCRCQITIMYFCFEEVTASGVNYRPRDPKMSSESVRFKAGAAQQFVLSDHTFTPSDFPETDLQYDYEQEIFPIVIHCVTLEGVEQSHTTTATVDKHGEDTYVLKPLKQKLFVDGLGYLLQEIYGIENKRTTKDDDGDSENATECVICMSDVRDTLILPCKHLCLCHSCGDSLRYQASNCPICRAPFRALLQIRAVYRIPPAPFEYPALPSDMPVIQMNAIPGYEMVPLLEALNSPYQASDLSSAAASLAVEAARVLSDDTVKEESNTNNSVPIAMQVMVKSNAIAPMEPKFADDDEDDEVQVDEEAPALDDDEVLQNIKEEMSVSCQSTPVRHPVKPRLASSSLPVTPNLTVAVSGASTRSSGDSFTSSCSTKQLLTQQ